MTDNEKCPSCSWPGFMICGFGSVMWLRCHRCGIDFGEQGADSGGRVRLVVVPDDTWRLTTT